MLEKFHSSCLSAKFQRHGISIKSKTILCSMERSWKCSWLGITKAENQRGVRLWNLRVWLKGIKQFNSFKRLFYQIAQTQSKFAGQMANTNAIISLPETTSWTESSLLGVFRNLSTNRIWSICLANLEKSNKFIL